VSALVTIVFVIAALIALAGAVGMLTARNPVHSALFLIANFLGIAVIFLLLAAPVLAVLQVLVYAGAIMVLFVFVIFFFVQPGQKHETVYSLPAQSVLAGIVVLAICGLLLTGFMGLNISGSDEAAPFYGGSLPGNLADPQAIGAALFAKFLLPFELVSVLLLAAIVGAVAMARGPRKGGGE
jgi:NADH-quinone oxidoreductase subunit J